MAPVSRTVLIIDDDEGMRDTLTAILRRDYRVLRAATGESGLAILAKETVDVVLLDVRMPGIGGFDVLREIRETERLVEVIMISAINEVETAVQAMKLGAYHYITKDFEYDAVLSLVRNASERAALNRKVLALSAQVADDRERPFVAGPSRGDARGPRPGPEGREDERDGAHPRRERHGQGAAGADDPRAVGARRRPVHADQRRGHPGRAGRVDALRPREGVVHRRGPAAARQVRARRRRHAVPRRDRRAAGRTCRRSCCARCRSRRSSASAAAAPSRSTCASSPPPTSTSRRRCARAGSARTSTTASA